jgi:hypothetical protein
MQNGLCHRRGAYATAFEKVPRACLARLGGAWALFVYKKGYIHGSEQGPAVMVISRLLAPDSVRSSALAFWPEIDGHPTPRAVDR